MANCIHNWIVYKGRKNTTAKANWCSICGQIKVEKIETTVIIKQN